MDKKPDITLSPVTSSALKAHGYDVATQTLAVQFNSGKTHYYRASPEVAKGLADAKSAGKFFAASVRGLPTAKFEP